MCIRDRHDSSWFRFSMLFFAFLFATDAFVRTETLWFYILFPNSALSSSKFCFQNVLGMYNKRQTSFFKKKFATFRQSAANFWLIFLSRRKLWALRILTLPVNFHNGDSQPQILCFQKNDTMRFFSDRLKFWEKRVFSLLLRCRWPPHLSSYYTNSGLAYVRAYKNFNGLFVVICPFVHR